MKNYLFLLLNLVLFTSCQEEITSNLKQIEASLKTDNATSSEFILKNDTVLKGKLGTEIFIPKDLFDNYTNGKITFELKEFYSKEDIIQNGLSTITDKDELLESSGMLYINFIEEGKQLAIKDGKKYEAQLPNKILANSNLYSNDTDSIFKWKFIEPIITRKDTTISDVVKNYQFGIKTGTKGEGGFFKDIVLTDTNTMAKIHKEDSLEISKLKERNKKVQTDAISMSEFDFDESIYEENGDIKNNNKLTEKEKEEKIAQRNNFYQKDAVVNSFTCSKLGWINCDRIVTIEKNIMLNINIKNYDKITNFSLYQVYKDNKSFIKDSYPTTSSLITSFKISGRIKVIVVSNANDTYLYDVFYVNKDSKTNFEINLKETSLENLKKVLISQ